MKNLLMILSLLAASCSSVPKVETPSGRPECRFESTAPSVVQNEILQRFMVKGYMLQQQDTNQLVFQKEIDSIMFNALMGSQYDPTTSLEVRCTFVGTGLGTHAYAQLSILRNEGSAFEARSDWTKGSRDAYEVWQLMLDVKRKLEG